uniref:Uncharacterized protein n=1 Tax=Siphoviridae sp. ctsoB6 TaxID=2826487 RepID=A0A8S5QN73_9CAUD|nr:MAG TPA: hypothetical protein [Siphoviridae sp. ctsoB6]
MNLFQFITVGHQPSQCSPLRLPCISYLLCFVSLSDTSTVYRVSC